MKCTVYIHTNKAEVRLTVHHLGFLISQYFERCVSLCLEVGNKRRILNYWPIRKNWSLSLDQYTCLSTHTCWAIYEENFTVGY